MGNKLKPPTAFQQQIDILEKRGLIIADKRLALEILSELNYYTFSGYLHDFRKPNSDDYIEGLTFEKIANVIEFDRRLRNVLMYALKEIAREFNTGPNQLESWMECTTYLRNMIAHYMRIYNFKIQKTPAICKKNHKHLSPTYRVFDIVYTMKFMFGDAWEDFLYFSIAKEQIAATEED